MSRRALGLALIEALRSIPEEWRRLRFLRMLTPNELLCMDACFEGWADEGQKPPEGTGWRTWLMLAGRNYGKTRAGAEWVHGLATVPGRPVRIALVGATEAEVRAVMVEGDSGLLAVAEGRRPRWEPSLGRLTWPGGSVAHIFSAENPERLRGPNHHFAWCDEVGKWARPDETWDNLQLTLRLGERPRALVTTTPRPLALLKRIRAEPWTVETGGPSELNITGGEDFYRIMRATYGATRLGRQELDGLLVEDFAGSLWPRGLIEKARSAPPERDGLVRIVIGVDPPASAGGDSCGIVVAGIDPAGRCLVLDDLSVAGMRPEGWAAAVARAAARWGADRVVAEANQGGAMVESVLRAARSSLPVRLVYASRGKVARAEPVALLFESGGAGLAGRFPELEDEMAGMIVGGGYQGPGRSPDRADAMVWAMTELMRVRDRPGPRVVQL